MNHPAIVDRAARCAGAIAIRSGTTTHSYQELLDLSTALAGRLLDSCQCDDLQESRIGLLVPPGADYVGSQWAIWRAGGIVVPLCLSATEPEWETTLCDAAARIVIASTEQQSKLSSLCARLGIEIICPDIPCPHAGRALPKLVTSRRAMILYTSGTTSKPKGVVTTHANIEAQIESLVTAWEWTSSDRIPLFLPLHHIHGIINVMSCALWCGASIETFPSFDCPAILDRVRNDAYTLFMAVPTIYVKLIEALNGLWRASSGLGRSATAWS